MTPAYPASDTPEDIAAATRFDGSFNRWFLDPLFKGSYPADLWEHYGAAVPKVEADDFKLISAPLDFLGVNYYSRAVVAHDPDGWLEQRGVFWPGITRGRT